MTGLAGTWTKAETVTKITYFQDSFNVTIQGLADFVAEYPTSELAFFVYPSNRFRMKNIKKNMVS